MAESPKEDMQEMPGIEEKPKKTTRLSFKKLKSPLKFDRFFRRNSMEAKETPKTMSDESNKATGGSAPFLTKFKGGRITIMSGSSPCLSKPKDGHWTGGKMRRKGMAERSSSERVLVKDSLKDIMKKEKMSEYNFE